MTDAADIPATETEAPEARRARLREERRRRLRRRLVWAPFFAGAGLVALVVLVVVVARFAVLTDTGRTTLVGWLDGMQLGRFGTLQLEGLSGDVFGDFKVRRLAVVDEQGVWLEGRNVAMRWRSVSLLRRRLWARSVTAEQLHVLRRPILEEDDPDKPKRDLPVSIRIDDARFRLITEPAFSVRRGDYNVRARARVARDGPLWAVLDAESLLHGGDGVSIAFANRPEGVDARVDAIEAAGGALAGALGLPADQQFVLRFRATGRAKMAQLSLLTRSGDTLPAVADGRWDGKQGRLRAGIDLTAFDLTEDYVARIGPKLGVSADLTPLEGQLYRVSAAVAADNLRATALGRVDVERRSTGGLRLSASSGSLTRLAGTELGGLTELDGMLSGALADLQFKGTGAVQALQLPDYRLASVAGPLTARFRAGELTVGGALQGRGGAGQGVLAALLGGAPRAEVELARLRDGRFLFRSIEAVGAGLRVQGSGSRGLLGDLAFRGDAALSNLDSIRPGAAGVFNAGFEARQGGSGRPWSFRFDGRGERLSTGLAQLDRLLGPRPRLQMTADYRDGRLQVERASLDGVAGEVSGRGLVAFAGPLDVDLDWRANGPFQAGPVTISGAINGEGEIGGTLARPRADLNARIGVLDLERLVLNRVTVGLTFVSNPNDFNGFVRVAGLSEYGPARANAGFRFVGNGLDLREVDVDAGGVRAQGAVSLRNGAPTTADFTFAAGPGAFLSAGSATGAVQLVDGGGGARAAVRLEGRNLALRGSSAEYVETISLTANGPLSRLPFTVSATGKDPQPYRFAGEGVYSRQGAAQVVTLGGAGRVRTFDMRTLEPAVLRLAPGERTARLRLAVGGGTVSLDGRQAGETLEARAGFDGLQVGTLSEDFAGRLDGSAVLQGRGDRLTGRLDANLQQARSLDAPPELALNGRVQAILDDRRLRLVASATNATGLQAAVDASLPTEASASPLRLAVVRTQPVSGTFSAQGELRPLWDLFYGGERTLAGYLTAQGQLGGTLNELRPRGQASLVRGRFEDENVGLVLRDVNFAAELQGERVFVRQLSASDGDGGSVSGGGEINLRLSGGSNFRAELKSFQLIDNELAEAEATGEVTVRRDAQGAISIAGDLLIDEAEIRPNPPTPSGVVRLDVIERNAPPRPNQRAPRPQGRGPAIALDVSLRAPRDIWVRGRGLNVELSLDAEVGGTINQPQLTGVARVVRGEYEFAGRRFEFDDRGVIRLGDSAEEIRLDLTAVREDPTLTAEIRVRGTAAEPEILLTSRPQLPQDEILSQVLFGRSASQLSALEAAQLASALSGLTGGGGFDVIGGLREFAGLDRLSFGGDAAGATVAGGKYISDDVYLEIIGGGAEGAAVAVEYQINRNLSLVSRLSGDTRISIRYRRERR